MSSYTCHIDKNFQHTAVLRQCLLNHIPIFQDNDFPYEKNKIVLDNGYHQQVIDWDSLIIYFYKKAALCYNQNYDFYYLKNAVSDACRSCYDLLCSGSSYMRFGIEEKMLERKGKNISLASQDIYYACKISKIVIDANPNIRDVLIGGSYYSFFSDLSRTKAIGEIMRISNVYYPLINDMHNAIILPDATPFPQKTSEIFNTPLIIDECVKNLYLKNNGEYFTEDRNRFSQRMYYGGDMPWAAASNKTKIAYANERAAQHNESLQYQETYQENVHILNEFLQYAHHKRITVWLLAFPMTEAYRCAFNPKFKEYYYQALESLNYEIQHIDFNDADVFSDSDFNDMDHLNDTGAAKATSILNSILCETELSHVNI